MSNEAQAWAFHVPLKPCPKAVLNALANRADEEGYCWPGLGDLERRTGWHKRSIQRALKYLEACQLLTISSRFSSDGVQTSNLYRLSLTPIPCGEGDRVSRGGVTGCHGQGDRVSPKSSSESSFFEQSSESPHPPTRGACVVESSVSREEFESFLREFPNKTGKKAAWRAWQKARDRPCLADLLSAIVRMKMSDRWKRGVIPNPARWLNEGRWADTPPESIPQPRVGPKAYQSAPVVARVGVVPCPPEFEQIREHARRGGTFNLAAAGTEGSA